MSLTSDTMTPADIAAVCGNNNRNNDGMFGNDWAWIVILLLMSLLFAAMGATVTMTVCSAMTGRGS